MSPSFIYFHSLFKYLSVLSIVFLLSIEIKAQNKPNSEAKSNFNYDWRFIKDKELIDCLASSDNTIAWEKVSLPHTPRIEPIEKKEEQWQGDCYYRKTFNVPLSVKGKHIALQFDAAMHEADVYLNGIQIFKHIGGFLPFYIDISNSVKFGDDNIVLLHLNNEDNSEIPPAKPMNELDFNFYGGLYRNAWLIIKDKLYISDAVQANIEAGGGVMLHYENVTAKSADLIVKTDVKNDFTEAKSVQVKLSLKDVKGAIVSSLVSDMSVIKAPNHGEITLKTNIKNPQLWSPDRPYLYNLSVEILNDGRITDRTEMKTGVRAIHFAAGSFTINGQKLRLRGTNRHQEYPYIGYALSDNAQYRDAFKIKQAGFNLVRCSHYPQSAAFLNACDELGILVMDAIPGWQYSGNQTFINNSLQNVHDMVRRDRNHPSIVLWEASLNETDMKKEYMEKAHKIVHAELPFQEIYTCGWLDTIYDVFIPARQHAGGPDYWKKYSKNKPLLIAEYGDWEYYAQNAGFNQTEFSGLKNEERNSRQIRGYGQQRLLQQALNYQESHNDNYGGAAVGDVNWLIFDYKRGYATDLQTSGIMDINRFPKFAYYFFQSQAGPNKRQDAVFDKPMIFIANYWSNAADTTIKIYSNTDEVELLVNGKSFGRQLPDKDKYSGNLRHAPFTFHVSKFTPGTIAGIGYIKGKKAVETTQKTPGKASKIELNVDYSGKNLQAGSNDVVFVYAYIIDENGTVVSDATNDLNFTVEGDAQIVGDKTVKAEAGIAAILLKAGSKAEIVTIKANGSGLQVGSVIVKTDGMK